MDDSPPIESQRRLDPKNDLPDDIDQLKGIIKGLVDLMSGRPDIVERAVRGTLATAPKNVISGGPYYRDKYGQELIPILDKLIETGAEVKIDCKDYGCTKNTLYLRIYQGWEFVSNNLDKPDGRYRKLRRMYKICRVNGGVVLRKDTPLSVSQLRHALVSDDVLSGRWREQFDDFITENKVGMKFSVTGLNLSDEEVSALKVTAFDPGRIMYIDNNSIALCNIGDPKKVAELLGPMCDQGLGLEKESKEEVVDEVREEENIPVVQPEDPNAETI